MQMILASESHTLQWPSYLITLPRVRHQEKFLFNTSKSTKVEQQGLSTGSSTVLGSERRKLCCQLDPALCMLLLWGQIHTAVQWGQSWAPLMGPGWRLNLWHPHPTASPCTAATHCVLLGVLCRRERGEIPLWDTGRGNKALQLLDLQGNLLHSVSPGHCLGFPACWTQLEQHRCLVWQVWCSLAFGLGTATSSQSIARGRGPQQSHSPLLVLGHRCMAQAEHALHPQLLWCTWGSSCSPAGGLQNCKALLHQAVQRSRVCVTDRLQQSHCCVLYAVPVQTHVWLDREVYIEG